ncbi:MAG: acyl-CoA dehydrogenase [Verrucomicrobiaceae bacterium]|nr:acyl-CoA dehydrogenase [Verrucomicrobiaceae bacterium]
MNAINTEMEVGELLAEQLARLFSERVTHQALTRVEQGAFDQVLWGDIEQLGVVGALTPELAGGAGLNWTQCAAIFQTLGEHAAPIPLAEAMLATWALGRAGIEADTTRLTVSSAIFEIDTNGKLHGADSLLPWAAHAQSVVAIAKAGDDYRLCLFLIADAEINSLQTIARLPSSQLIARGVTPQINVPAPNIFGPLGLQPALATARATALAGTLARMLELTIEYANTRSQFGKTIGRFQAIQHLIAEFAELTAAAQVAAAFACRQFDRGVDASERGAAVAKIRAGQSATRAAMIAHQVFGAIGFTDEHILHFYSRRLWQWRSEAGSEHWWAEWLGQQTLAAGGDALWSGITG